MEIDYCKCYTCGMSIDQATLTQLISNAMPDAQIRIDDLRGDGEAYAAHIGSPHFAGQSRVKQHQMVYAALGNIMDNDLHALQIHTYIIEKV